MCHVPNAHAPSVLLAFAPPGRYRSLALSLAVAAQWKIGKTPPQSHPANRSVRTMEEGLTVCQYLRQADTTEGPLLIRQ